MTEEKEKTWQLIKKVYRINVRITKPLYDVVLRVLDSGRYYNTSEFFIDLLQKHFKNKGIKIEINDSGEDKDLSKEEVTKDSAIINARIPIPMKKAVDQVLDGGVYLNISHYMREAVRKDLEERGFQF